MPNVLVLGSGLIGFDVALAFVAKGYKVYTTTRSQSKADRLNQLEIQPIIVNTIQETGKWESIARKADIIVEALADYSDRQTAHIVADLLTKIKQKRELAVHIVYTSGIWIWGASQVEPIEESTPILQNTFTRGRLDVQDKYLKIGGSVILPSLVYGRDGGLSNDYFKQVLAQKGVTFFGTEDTWTPFVHASDLAQLYVLVAESPRLTTGQIYVGSVTNEKRSDIINAIANSLGLPKPAITYVQGSTDYEKCLGLSQKFSNRKGKQLGWNPVQPSISDDPKRYLDSFQAFSKSN
ncbi:hypothetical protein DFA_07384 [Cavenderia fasciculata]|uniref:NAD-dependent epimerase/dehydratase domain-containing protein n=1 Tax=Cavenderia fasciculata TaxID=261658 RepID=F4PW97_CACFS|nr:uncharacterized protein DFA_07384 [Cavenderia fasciculata]EGG20261.1 hypothetical protein DFA_07384 [Cavenderia fasciculata]|eukprot:XP_004367244.1 hypothetical protein DFA_07384 [Cavenderia fasciculata]